MIRNIVFAGKTKIIDIKIELLKFFGVIHVV